jgi:hypothetical protein
MDICYIVTIITNTSDFLHFAKITTSNDFLYIYLSRIKLHVK